MLKTDDITDYAMPLMKIERMCREIHDLCLVRKYEEAREVTLQLGVENRILQATLALMQEKENYGEASKHPPQTQGRQELVLS